MNSSSERMPLARKKRGLMAIRISGLAALLAATALLWGDLRVLGAVAGAVLLLTVTGLYLVEVRYARDLERALARSVEWGRAWTARTIPPA